MHELKSFLFISYYALFSQLVLIQKMLRLPSLFFLKKYESCFAGIFNDCLIWTPSQKPLQCHINFRMLDCILLYCYPTYEGFMFYGRKARCTSWSICRPTTSFERDWRYEKLVFQANSCCFKDVRNPRGELFLFIKGFQVIQTCRCSPVRMKFSVM